jgi:two-component system, OmpR family, response regulator
VNPATQLIPALPPAHPPLARVRWSAAGAAAGTAIGAAAGTAAGADPEPRPLRAGDLVLDETRWTVHRAGTPVGLSPTEFRLLAYLMRHQDTVVSRAELLRSVWGRGFTGQPQVVETYVSYLRRKLGRLGPPLIHTRRGSGYVLRGPDAPFDRGPVL